MSRCIQIQYLDGLQVNAPSGDVHVVVVLRGNPASGERPTNLERRRTISGVLQKRITSGETHVIQNRRLSGLAKVISITLLSANSEIPMERLQLPLELAVSNADAVPVVDILGRSPQNNYGGGNCGSLYLARVVAGFKGSNQMIEFFGVTLDLDPEEMPTRALVMAFPSPQLQLDAWIYHISLATAEETQVFTCRTRAPLFVPEFATTV